MTGILRHPCGPRVYVAGVRVHHGAAGAAMAIAGAIVGRRGLVVLGVAALVHDRQDFPFRDCDNHGAA